MPAPSLAAALQPDYWRELIPGLHVAAGNTAPMTARAVDTRELEKAAAALAGPGFAQLAGMLPSGAVAVLASAPSGVQAAGWPAVFSFVYDEVWQAYQALDAWFEGLLGPGYLRMPDFWAFCLSGQPDHAGFPAHRERQYRRPLRTDGSCVAISAWLALSPSTVDNGCLHVLPMDRDPEPRTFDPLSRWLRERFGSARPWRRRSLATSMPLPATAGDLIVLNPWVLHWSGTPRPPVTQPRISIALEFQRGDEPPLNRPLTPPATLPEFAERVRLCAQQVVQYRNLVRSDPALLAMLAEVAGKLGRSGVSSR